MGLDIKIPIWLLSNLDAILRIIAPAAGERCRTKTSCIISFKA